jgi:HlyD family secretion protein
LTGFALLLLGLAGGGAWWAAHRAAPVHYVTAEITSGPVTRVVTATGTVNPVLTIIVGTYVSGVIQQLFCDYNTQVKQGQICARIDPRPYQVVVDQAKAVLDVAKAQLDKDKANLIYAEVNYERNAKLAERQFTSQDIADNAKSVYQQAVAQVALDEATIGQRQAELEAANVNLGYTDIVSPVDGTVVSRNVTQGQTVAATFQTPTLFLIATDLTKMEVDTNVSESDIGNTKEGDKATFTVDAFPKRLFQGSVVQVRQSPQTVQNVVTYDVVVGVDNTDLALMPGMTASTQVISDQRAGVIRVPDQALRFAPGGPAAGGETEPARVWLLRDGRAVPVPVTLGLDDDTFTEVVSGDVKPGDQVIMSEQRGTTATVPLPRF